MLFFFNDTATTEIYTLSLHDALPILAKTTDDFALLNLRGSLALLGQGDDLAEVLMAIGAGRDMLPAGDRKSTRLNSSHANISYAVFCLKKKKTTSSLLLPLAYPAPPR